MNNRAYIERYYYTLQDFLMSNANYELDNMVGDWDFVGWMFDSFMGNTEGDYDPIYADNTKNAIANELLNKYMVPRYYNWAIGWVDGEEPNDINTGPLKRHFIYKLWMILKGTYGKYAPLIGVYKDQEAKLMADIKTTGISRYNDTPQDGGDWSSDQHTTNISTSESTSTGATIAVRLAEIRAMWENLYSEWASEFKGLFIWIGE